MLMKRMQCIWEKLWQLNINQRLVQVDGVVKCYRISMVGQIKSKEIELPSYILNEHFIQLCEFVY